MSGTALRRRAATTGLTIADLREPWVQIHRGAGGNIAKDNALSALDLAYSIGLPITNYVADCDVDFSSDGVPFCLHDSTLDRTTDGTGTASSKTWAQLQTYNLRDFPLWLGTISSEKIPSFAQWLDRVEAYGMLGTPEIKANSAALGQVVADMIVARGLQNRMIVGSFYPASLGPAKAAGIRTYLAQTAGTNQSAASILTAVNGGPPTYVAYAYDSPGVLSDAWLSTLIAGGCKLWPFTFERRSILTSERARLVALGSDVSAYSSDDPFYTGQLVLPRTSDRLATQKWEHGIIPSTFSNTPSMPRIGDGGRIKFTSSVSQYALMGAWCRESGLTSVQARFTFDALDSTTTRFAAIAFGCSNDAPFHEQGSTTSKSEGLGYHAALRQNGGLVLSKRTSPTVAVAMATEVSTAAPGLAGSGLLVPEFLPDGHVRVTRSDTGQSITSTAVDTTYRGGFWHAGKNGATGSLISVDQIAVTP